MEQEQLYLIDRSGAMLAVKHKEVTNERNIQKIQKLAKPGRTRYQQYHWSGIYMDVRSGWILCMADCDIDW